MKTDIVDYSPRNRLRSEALMDALTDSKHTPRIQQPMWLRTGLAVIQVVGVAIGIILLFVLIWGVTRDVMTFSSR